MSRSFPNILAKTAVLTEVDEPGKSAPRARGHLDSMRSAARRHSTVTAALALLLVGTAAIRIGGAYWSSVHIKPVAKSAAAPALPARSIAGFNVTVPADELQSKLNTITHQPINLTVGSYKTTVGSGSIKSWLQITANDSKTEYYIHTNETAMGNSLVKLAGQYQSAPVNKVTVDEDGTKRVVLAGQNGLSLSDPAGLKSQAKQYAKSVLDGKGMNFNTGLKTTAYHSVTPANFNKLIVVNVTAKKMWIFQNGKQIRTYLVSAGKPSTPTPLGEYHIYAKYTVQDMRGTNPDGTPYFQPQVPWVNYFYEGSAIHGVYWHPLSWFGAINSSHGCVGLPVDEAEWVFNWAPMGMPIITHA